MECSKKYRLIANRLIRNLLEFADIKAAKVKIAYLSSLEEKKRNKWTGGIGSSGKIKSLRVSELPEIV